MPNSITQATRRKVMDLFLLLGHDWSGRLDEPDFLARIYDLAKMPSDDSRYKDAYGDIRQHRVNNADWPDDYVFVDRRFNLLHGPDADLLRFLTEMLHPVVRASEEAAALGVTLNRMLGPDGFEIRPMDEINGQPIYGHVQTPNQEHSGSGKEAATQIISNKGHTKLAGHSSSDPSKGISRAVSLAGGLPGKVELKQSTGHAPQARIFVVHGRNNSAKDTVHLFLNQLTRKDAVILHEQGNLGQSLIEKLEKASDTASYAVIILTADDLGKEKNEPNLSARGRQNVVFEMGYFMGKLGRENVAVLMEEGVEEPGDIRGMLYIAWDAFGGWKNKLAGEIRHAGHDVDLSILTR